MEAPLRKHDQLGNGDAGRRLPGTVMRSYEIMNAAIPD
jgi:hypothetical protein